jgi:hypothetical protein
VKSPSLDIREGAGEVRALDDGNAADAHARSGRRALARDGGEHLRDPGKDVAFVLRLLGRGATASTPGLFLLVPGFLA